MADTLKSETEVRAMYSAYEHKVLELQGQLAGAEDTLSSFVQSRAHRGAVKGWEICGAEDAWHPRHPEGHPAYDEDDLVPDVQCQLPKGHESRWHQEWSEDGRLLGEWSG